MQQQEGKSGSKGCCVKNYDRDGRGGEKEVRKKRSVKGKDEKKKEMTVAA